MNPAMSIPEVKWFIRGPKVAIFEMPPNGTEVQVDVSELRPQRGGEEVDPNDILAEFPADNGPDVALELRRPDEILARAATLDLEDTKTSMRAYRSHRTGWLVAIVLGATLGLVLATGLSIYASVPIAHAPRPHVKAQIGKSLVPSVAALGAVVPTVSIDSLPRAR
jgi:hypothetical protein